MMKETGRRQHLWRPYVPAARRRRVAKAVTWFAVLTAGLWLASCTLRVDVAAGNTLQIEMGDGAWVVQTLAYSPITGHPNRMQYPYQIGPWPLYVSRVNLSPGMTFAVRYWRNGPEWGVVFPLWIPAFGSTLAAVWLWRSCRTDPSRCPRCGYDLRKLTVPRCPECGLRYIERHRWVWSDKPPRQTPET